MNQSDLQPGSTHHESYFDPDALDASEQEFSASLDATEDSEFVIDSAEEAGAGAREQTQTSRPADRRDAGAETPISPTNQHKSEPSGSPRDGDWRDVVSAKVKRYRTQKPRKERYPSLQLQFESGRAWGLDGSAPAQRENVFTPDFPDETEAPPIAREPVPRPRLEITNDATARVLEFPRPGMLPFNRDELAEPVVDRPRIVEAPEIVPPPPALGGILIEPAQAAKVERQPGLDMPINSAPLSLKILATMVDGTLVTSALMIFQYMFVRFNGSLPELRSTVEIGAGLAGILWFAYQYAFLNFCGTTLGLRLARLKISKFDGAGVPRKLRRWRVFASLLSCVSLGLGYAWCLFDEDQLTWHDRITRTHLAPSR